MSVSDVKSGLMARVKAATAAGILAAASLNAIPVAHASDFGIELNGTWRVISNGDWAKTNEVYMNEQTTVQTWTITSSCISPIECLGEITSDQGWTIPVRMPQMYWIADRPLVPNWAPCPDGTFADGSQKFFFWGADPARNERNLLIRDFMAGRNITRTAPGACGRSQPLVIEMPMRLERLS